jgi:hypothetical protein
MTASILRLASLLAPAAMREEWLAEWRGELAHIQRFNPGRALAFSSGAFRDAFWLRRYASQDARAFFTVDSPLVCLSLLAILAVASVTLSIRSNGLRAFETPRYREQEKIALVTRRAGVTPTFAEIPVAEYLAAETAPGGRVPGASEVAFYAITVGETPRVRLSVAVASRNLFELLGVPAPSSGVILSHSTWHRLFKDDAQVIGRKVMVAGKPYPISGILPDGAWRMRGYPFAWLLDDSLVRSLPEERRGYMVARLGAPVSSAVTWPMATENARLGFAPLPDPPLILVLLLLGGMAIILLLAAAPGGLGAYPATRYAPSLAIRLRRWIFLALKIALLLPAVIGGTFCLGVVPLVPSVVVMVWMLASRWALTDQRNRCPVCLHSLAHPVRIGAASHMFLDWYGAELVCTRGHGLLHVPEIRASCYHEQRWLYLDPSWSSLQAQ